MTPTGLGKAKGEDMNDQTIQIGDSVCVNYEGFPSRHAFYLPIFGNRSAIPGEVRDIDRAG